MNPRCTKHNREMEQEPCELCAGTGIDLHAWGDNLGCTNCDGHGMHRFCPTCREEVVTSLSKRTPKVSREQLAADYATHSVTMLGHRYGVSSYTVRHWLLEYKIPRRHSGERVPVAVEDRENEQ